MNWNPNVRVKFGAGLLVVAVLAAWLGFLVWSARPYQVAATDLSNWQLVTGEPGGPILVALQPPAALATALFRQLNERSALPVVAPPRPLVPLVMQREYEDSLQGVFSVDDIMNVARAAGFESSRFEPICAGRHRDMHDGPADEYFYVLFDAPAFDAFRQQLAPLFPEHGGSGIFEPTALHPMLTVAVTEHARKQQMTGDPRKECRTAVRTY